MEPILSVQDLSINFYSGGKEFKVIQDLSFNLFPGETLSLVGESGSGKSVTALSILQLLPKSAQIKTGSIKFIGEELIGKSESYMSTFRLWTIVASIFWVGNSIFIAIFGYIA